MKTKSLWVLLGLACVGCCVLPLMAAFGIAAAIPVFLWKDTLDILLCLAPVVAIVFLLWRKRRQRCCEAPGQACSDDQCENKTIQ